MSVIVARPVGSVGEGIFGKNYSMAESLGVTTTTQSAFQEKVSMSTGGIPLGTYRIGWSFQWNHNSITDDFEGRVQLDNITNLSYIQLEPSDSSEDNGTIGPTASPFSTTGTDQRNTSSGFRIMVLPAGNHIIDIDFRTNNTLRESSIWNAQIEFWRVS